jgi:ribonucleoside-diphosphate reductase alpha chain
MYYLRTKAAADAIKFTVEKQAEEQMQPVLGTETEVEVLTDDNLSGITCALDNKDDCEACGS